MLPVSFVVRINVGDWRQARDLTAGDVGRIGLFVHSSRPAEIGVGAVAELILPDGNVLRLRGEVVPSWSIEQAPGLLEIEGFGIKFDESHASDLALLEALADSHIAGTDVARRSEEFITLPVLLISVMDGSQQMTSAHRTALDAGPDPAQPGLENIIDDKGAVEIVASGDLNERSDISSSDLDIDVGEFEEDPAEARDGRATAEHVTLGAGDGQQTAPPDEAAAPGSPPTIFGIDFGTSFSRIAAIQDKQVTVLADAEGQTLLPSVVHYPRSGQPVVGWPARFKLATEPRSTVASPKRLLGIRYSGRAAQTLLAQMKLPATAGPSGHVVAKIHNQPIAIPQVVADILRQLVHIGEKSTGIPVKRVVIGAPVTFKEDQRTALKRAAQLAGLEVVAMVHEPFAAALAYGIRSSSDETVAVYDFGGGTFDFTLARIAAGRFTVIGQSGDQWLGGQDFDLAMAGYAADVFERQRKIDLRKRQVEWQQLLLLCEQVKHRLSDDEEADLLARRMMRSIQGPIDLHVSFNRELLAKICGSLVDRSIDVVDSCVRHAGLKPEDLDQVVMTGGVSRIPLVRERVQKYFHRPLNFTVSPEQAIVIGNTLYGRLASA